MYDEALEQIQPSCDAILNECKENINDKQEKIS